MKVCITGSTGLLGTHLIRSAPKDVTVVGTVHEYQETVKRPQVTYVSLDIRQQTEVANVLKEVRPDIIIHTAAHTSVDFCENNQEDTYQTNVLGLKYLIHAAKAIGSKIIFCSTNMTYDGLEPPYSEESPQNPQTYYGKTKVQGESLLKEANIPYTIVRLMTMYGWNWQPQRKNMISMAIEKLRKNEKLWMTNDVFNNLLYVHEAAAFLWRVVSEPKLSDYEVYNIAGADCINRYQATIKLCEVFNYDKKLITEVSSSYFANTEVTRSPNTCFNTNKAHTMLSFKPMGVDAGLKNMRDNTIIK